MAPEETTANAALKTIQQRIKEVQQKIDAERAADPAGQSATADELQKKAAAAILRGGTDVKSYMECFCKDPTDPASPVDEDALAKLMPDPASPPTESKNLARAYLIGNGNCGPASPVGAMQGLLFTVGDALDD